MIPHKLHYVWVGGAPIPAKYQAFIDHWAELMPDWEIVRWDESNFDIENSSDFCRQAYEHKRWAFVSDYIRVKVLYEHGGIYLDTDEQMVQSLERFAEHNFFVGMEPVNRIGGQVFGCEAKNEVMGAILAHYNGINFQIEPQSNTTVIGARFGQVLKELYPTLELKEEAQHLDQGVVIYPSTYFCPDLMMLKITDESYTIHRPMASWGDRRTRLTKQVLAFIASTPFLRAIYVKIKR